MKLRILFCLVLAAAVWQLSVYGCRLRKQRLFAEYVLIREGGMYILMGSKPMCYFPMSNGPKAASPKSTARDVQIKGLQFSKNNHFVKELWELWSVWEKYRNCSGNGYVFSRMTIENREYLVFANRLLTREVLERHRDIFKSELGQDFEINQVMDDIESSNSPFWTRVLSSHLLKGLVFGYGEDNANKFSESDNEKVPDGKLSTSMQDLLNARLTPKVLMTIFKCGSV